MADTYTLPALTAANINGIVTAGQDGTYNITYTNLTANQIAEIGAAFEQAMQNNLKPIALSGNYNDLENKPSASNLQGFHKVAFSGKTSDLNNDKGFLTSFTETDPIFAASVAATITDQNIIAWTNKSNFSGNYEDLNGAPELPEDIDNQSNAYYTINENTENESRKLKPLKVIAFTNNYDDLSNRPNTLNDLLNLTNFNKLDNNVDNNKLHNLEQTSNFYILNFNEFYNLKNESLKLYITNLAVNFLDYGKTIYLKDNTNFYLVNNIKRKLNNNNQIIYLKFILYNLLDNFDINENDNFDETQIANQLSNLAITSQLSCLIFDYINNTIYYKSI